MEKHHIILPFTQIWWIGIILSTVGIWAVIQFGKELKSEKERQFSLFLGILFLGRAVFHNAYLYVHELWALSDSLPLHLCGISAILAGILLLKPKQLGFEFIILLGIPGAIHSFLTPELTNGYGTYFLFEYYFSHSAIIVSGLYLMFVHGMALRKGSWKMAFLFGQGLLIFIGFMNVVLNSNYMYLMKKPLISNPFIVGEWPFYILGFEVAGILHIFIFYVLFNWLSKRYLVKISV
jgi:hypothetical integral membrane protein (TIGR02206 family)